MSPNQKVSIIVRQKLQLAELNRLHLSSKWSDLPNRNMSVKGFKSLQLDDRIFFVKLFEKPQLTNLSWLIKVSKML